MSFLAATRFRIAFPVFYSLVLTLAFHSVSAQQIPLDSLLRQEKSYLQEDSVRAKLLTDIARRYYAVDPQTGTVYAEKAIRLSETLPDKKWLAGAYSAMGANTLTLGEYPLSLNYYQKALEINLKTGNIQGEGNNYNNLGLVYYSIFDYPRALEYYQKTLSINEKTGNKAGMANALGNIGNIYNVLQDSRKAIEYYQKALEISEKTGNLQNVAGNLVNIGNSYSQLNDYSTSLEYKRRAMKIYEQLGNKSGMAINLANMGNNYIQMGDYTSALDCLNRATTLSEQIKDNKNAASCYTNLGKVHFLQKNYAEAARLETKAYEHAQRYGVLNFAGEALLNLSQIYEATGKYDSAYYAYRNYIILKDSINSAEKQKEITKKTLQFEFGKKEDSLRQHQLLTDAKLQQQMLLAAKQQQELELKQTTINLTNKERELQHLAFLKSQADLKFEQSVTREKEEQLKMADNEKALQNTRSNLQQAQIDLQIKELRTRKMQSFFYAGGIALLSLLSFFIFRNFLNQRKSNRIIQAEKQKSEDLLLNILPAEVADKLKNKGRAPAQLFDSVTVLFTDFVDFTLISESLSPETLVHELHAYFKAFDEIIERYGLEKIKTIGDAYMAVSGLPMASEQHAQLAARASLDILSFVRERQESQSSKFQIRIGLHSGPVVAGIVGVKKFAYDIWGDTVNTAARMESGSEPDRINVSEATFALIQNEFSCEHRGAIPVKNKGKINMYFLTGKKPGNAT